MTKDSKPGTLKDFSDESKIAIPYRKVTLEGHVYFVPSYAMNRPASRSFLLQERFHEPKTHELMKKIMANAPYGNIVHAGTFFGDMLPSFSEACPETVFAFEPVTENFMLAKLCVDFNRLDNVFLLNAALGDELGISRVYTGDHNGTHRGGASTISDTKGQTVPTVPLDSFGLENVAAIHLDVEGYELGVILGARKTIEQSRPTLLIEDSKRACDSFLRNRGYEYVGDIPEIRVWAPQEKASKTKEMLDF